MCDIASVHDEIVRQRHDPRHCERGVERHRLIYVQRPFDRSGRTGSAYIDGAPAECDRARRRGQDL